MTNNPTLSSGSPMAEPAWEQPQCELLARVHAYVLAPEWSVAEPVGGWRNGRTDETDE